MANLWQNSLLTGVDKIDTQHKELVRRIENVLNMGMQGQGTSEVASTLKFLSDYVLEHFRDEERLQLDSRYPKYAAHKTMHTEFVKRVNALIVEFNAKGPTMEMMLATNRVVVDWLINHINSQDKEFASYYKQKMSAQAPR